MKTFGTAVAVVCVCVLVAAAFSQTALGTAFTYQGRLTDAGLPANGTYDLRFMLYDSTSGGTQIGPTVALEDVVVEGGLFTVSLDFGAGAFTGQARWLDIALRPGASGGGYTSLSARQELKPSPNALFSASGSVPAGAVMFFNLASCPSGWTALAAAQGRYLVGVLPTGTLAGTVGTALTDRQNRPVGRHYHNANSPEHTHASQAHAHSYSHQHEYQDSTGWVGGIGGLDGGLVVDFTSDSARTTSSGGGDTASANVTLDSTSVAVNVDVEGAVNGTNAPYLQLLVCQKN